MLLTLVGDSTAQLATSHQLPRLSVDIDRVGTAAGTRRLPCGESRGMPPRCVEVREAAAVGHPGLPRAFDSVRGR